MKKQSTRIEALASHLGCDVTEIGVDGDRFTVGRNGPEYLVLSDEQADAYARDYILDNLWAFKPEFIIQHTALPRAAVEMLRHWQTTKCEDANDTIHALLADDDDFVAAAIAADGRGHFLAGYDSEEVQVGQWFIYRTN